MGLSRTIPSLPVRDVVASVQFYSTRFGFKATHQDVAFAVVERDEARLHLCRADDDEWRARSVDDLRETPVRSGAESFLAGTASCRIELDRVEALDHLYAELATAGVLHPGDSGAPRDTDFGSREFATLDADGNLLEFYCWLA